MTNAEDAIEEIEAIAVEDPGAEKMRENAIALVESLDELAEGSA